MGVGISLSGLASAVANAGGVGVISSAGLGLIYNHLSKNLSEASILGLKEELRKVRELEQQHGKHIPVIAGGGIYTGEDIHNIMALGADAAQMGTRFVVTEECDADIKFKQAYINATKEDVTIIQSPVGMPGRAIRNGFLDAVKDGLKKPKNCAFNCIKTCDVVNSPYCIMLALFNAFKGKMENGYAFAGSNAWRCDKILKVGELFDELITGYRAKAISLE